VVEPLLDSNIKVLAEPDEQAKQQSQLLKQHIQTACKQKNGWLKFSEFMNIALYQPALGYYSGGLQKFGQQGDFITAPEVSPLFGQCLANQVAEVIKNLEQSSDNKVYVIEFGAGSGVLAADMLLQLEKLDCLPAKYFIIELSAELKQRQKQTIKQKAGHLLRLVQWLDQLPKLLTNAVVVANEVLDAMPVEGFRIADEGKVESLMVGFEKDRLVSSYQAADNQVTQKVEDIGRRSEIEFTQNYHSEYNPAIAGWLSALESSIKNLLILLIDYGYNEKEYYHPERVNGTLMCYYQHRAHENFFWWPGLQDITAFVDFTDVAYSAINTELEVSGYTTQAAFLLANGLSELHESQVTDEVQQQIKLSQQIKTLTLPSEMGERFKVMALTKNYDALLTGFSMLDLRNRL
jgi:SAM-dependent MidA family methyltransferase